MARQQAIAILLGIFAVIAVLLATIGVYGVLSYSVVQRTHEFGIRMALGSSRRAILLLVAQQAAKLLGIGVTAGAIISLGLARLVGSLLFGIALFDPASIAASTSLLAMAVLLAAVLPSSRAASASPNEVLRSM